MFPRQPHEATDSTQRIVRGDPNRQSISLDVRRISGYKHPRPTRARSREDVKSQTRAMKNIPPRRRRGTFLAVLASCFAVGLAAAYAAAPRLQLHPLGQGKWPVLPRGGNATDVKVRGNYAYVAIRRVGLAVIDVSNPTNCVQVGGYGTSGEAQGVAVLGNYAYVADSDAGLQVIDVSDPTNCARVGGYRTAGRAGRGGVGELRLRGGSGCWPAGD